jgi:HK97 family phage prohead protease
MKNPLIRQKRGPAKAKTLELNLRQASPEEWEAVKKALGDEIPEGYIAGWASTPSLDSYRDVVMPGAFDEAIQTRGLTGPKGIKLLLNHDWAQVAGAIKVLEQRGNQLWIEAQLNLKISYAADMHEAIKSAGGLSFSVGFFLKEYNIRKDANDRDYFELVKGDLFEVSVVPFPANSDAVMEFYKSADIALEAMGVPLLEEEEGVCSTLAEFEKMLVSNGIVKSRNDARLVTLEVQQHAHLFVKTKGNEPEIQPAPTPKEEQEPKALMAEGTEASIKSSLESLHKAFSFNL